MTIENVDSTRTGARFLYLDGPQGLAEEKPQVVKDRLPVPQFLPIGKKILVLQDTAEEKRGSIIIPPQDRQKYRPTLGTVVGIGDGYDPDMLTPEDWCPLNLGDRVLWGKFDGDLVIRVPVEESWWDSPEEKKEEDGKIEVTVLHIKQVLGVLV